jgi:hypothetical protein
MYDLIRSGALLDSEFFPESINRRSFADSAEYVRFLNKRQVDYVSSYALYDTAHGTNEHVLLDELTQKTADGVCADKVAIVFGTQLLALDDGLILGEFGSGTPDYEVYRIQRSGC